MGWHGMDMNMNVDMFLNKMCCRYLFSCGKKIRKNEIQLTLTAAFTLYINIFFLFLLLLHKNMTRWLDPTRTFFGGSDSQRSIIYVRGKCIDVTDRQEAAWKRWMVRVWGAFSYVMPQLGK